MNPDHMKFRRMRPKGQAGYALMLTLIIAVVISALLADILETHWLLSQIVHSDQASINQR